MQIKKAEVARIFEKPIDCPMSFEDYIAVLKRKGYIKMVL